MSERGREDLDKRSQREREREREKRGRRPAVVLRDKESGNAGEWEREWRIGEEAYETYATE